MQIAIIGGGITGLTTALTLHKMGFKDVTVYEQAEKLNEIGAGIWLQPNAVRIMEWLGLKDELLAVGSPLNKMEITYANLKPIKEIQEEVVEDEHGNRTLAIHRGKLQHVLYDAVTSHMEVELGSSYERHSVNDQLDMLFTKGEARADVLLAADGIHSKVRQQLFERSKLRDANQICWRGISSYDLPNHLRFKGKEAWGRNRRFGFSEIGKGLVYWFAVMNFNDSHVNASKESILENYDQFDPVVANLITNTAFIHEAKLMDLKRLPSWSIGNVCLLGDAAHATTPNMGQGACQGIEDAFYIAQNLKKEPNISAAFAAFENGRRRKVDYVVTNSWRFGKMAHHSVGQSILKLVMKATPEAVLEKQMKQLYAIDI